MTDVVIAGAGPNGLMLAAELALAGVRPLVLDPLPEPATEPKANGLVGQVVRLLDRRGLYERLAPGRPRPAPAFVFGALPLDLADLDDHPLHVLGVPQRRLEGVLAEHAADLGVEVRRGHAVHGLDQDGGGVTVEVDGPTGTSRVTAAFLVGADGGHSTIRGLAGIGFPGVTRDDSVSRSAHVTVPSEWVDADGGLTVPGYGRVPGFAHHRTDRGLVVFARFPGRADLVTTTEWDTPEPDDPMSLAEMRESLGRVLGADVPLAPPAGAGPHLLRRLRGGNTRLADRYRVGRVLLVGDAAHVHSGIGGPGLNLGLQDAANLGWKLAAEVRGTAPTGLLDSYESERRPAAERVVVSSQAQSALLAPGSETTALRTLVAELMAEPVVRGRIADLMSGADVRYDTGDDHPLAGRFAPDVETVGAPLAVRSRTARPLWVAPAGWPAVPGLEAVEAAAGPAMLVRPDGYVAWAGTEPDGMAAALDRWVPADEFRGGVRSVPTTPAHTPRRTS
ncbi:FAD-dependent monooxygenase [Pseudonocardia xishanensis]|uniref:FAD-dependent monooxygenase n=1 Tax=Pseudonocardia xishanensis TaxID=630995 RepID=A0ABP8S4N2_9PSEU